MNLRTRFPFDLQETHRPHLPEGRHLEVPQPAISRSALAAANAMQQLIDDLPEEIALLDESGNFLIVNKAWRQTVLVHDQLDALPGHNYRDFCTSRAAEGYQPAVDALAGLDEILCKRREWWELIYNGGERWRGRDYHISIHRIAVGREPIISVTRDDITEIMQLRRKRQDLAHTLIEGQAVERQRIGRELHDSTSQLLAAMGLVLGRLRQESPEAEALGLVEEMQELLQEVHQEIRSVSYLAHPPSLKKLGLAQALQSLLEGFGRRTGLKSTFEIRGEAVPMSPSTESTIYRLAQEALSNVHRHARATRVSLRISFGAWSTHVVVADDGVGIPRETLSGQEGVGLPSMRSRLSEIGGRLTIRSLSPGTAIIGTVPIAPRFQPVQESPASSQRPFLCAPAAQTH